MGAKVTIDSATLINKGLELIEAHWLFGLESHQLDAVIHRQSAVHAIAETTDRGLIAQLAAPDMRLPIQAALTAPHLAPAPASRERLDLASLGTLDFTAIDPDRFPAVELALDVIATGGGAGCVFTAAAEAAVEAFIAGKLPFGRIDTLTAEITRTTDAPPPARLEDIFELDASTRARVGDAVAKIRS